LLLLLLLLLLPLLLKLVAVCHRVVYYVGGPKNFEPLPVNWNGDRTLPLETRPAYRPLILTYQLEPRRYNVRLKILSAPLKHVVLYQFTL